MPEPGLSTPPLLRLPVELRQQIYSFLLPREIVSHPIPSVGITSVSHRPPSPSLLNIHPTITAELLHYFYAIATWKLVFSHAFNFFRVDPDLRRLEGSTEFLSRLRKFEVVFFCDIALVREYPSFGVEKFCVEIRRRAERACEVLTKADGLRTVVVSWCDSTEMGSWEDKAGILEPLGTLGRERTDIVFRIGKITAPEYLNRELFTETLRAILGETEKKRLQDDGVGEDETQKSLRLLAFDIRQERHKFSPKPGTYPLPAVGRSGWKGAPPALQVPREAEEDADRST